MPTTMEESTTHDSLANHGLLPGLAALLEGNAGCADICIAVLDGPVDTSHPCFTGANLQLLDTLATGSSGNGRASQHGTHVASIIFGQPGSPVTGLAPRCRGLILPIFADRADGALTQCTQLDLARAITQAVEHGAHIINVSGGELSDSGAADGLLQKAIQLCHERNVLLVAAAGNDGCDCLHIPASIEYTLVVGALDRQGAPMPNSNWGEAYRARGIMAPGTDILGAAPAGRVLVNSGTSFATPIVSAIAALLLCRQHQHGDRPDPRGVCSALLQSATRCNTNGEQDCRRLLTGTLNVPGATQLIFLKGKIEMSDDTVIEASPANADTSAQAHPLSVPMRETPSLANLAAPSGATRQGISASGIDASDCGCGGGAAKGPTLVYALGNLGIDFGSEARHDSFVQAMPPGRNNPDDPQQLIEFLRAKPYFRQSLTWTVNLDATPIYAIVPVGPYADLTYELLFEAFVGTIDGKVVMNSFPGVIAGAARLMSGQVVPVIQPAIRGMFSWNVPELISSLMAAQDNQELNSGNTGARLENFLNRIYYDFRNLGVTGMDRALNFSATNAMQAAEMLAKTTGMQLDTIVVQQSPVCRPGSECYDIIMTFFNPENLQVANTVARFAVDVSDVIPVSVGPVRYWSQR